MIFNIQSSQKELYNVKLINIKRSHLDYKITLRKFFVLEYFPFEILSMMMIDVLWLLLFIFEAIF